MYINVNVWILFGERNYNIQRVPIKEERMSRRLSTVLTPDTKKQREWLR